MCKKLRCFLEKITQLTKILHDRGRDKFQVCGDSGIGKGIVTNSNQDAYEEDDVLDGDDVHDVMKIMKLKMIVTMNTMIMLMLLMMIMLTMILTMMQTAVVVV